MRLRRAQFKSIKNPPLRIRPKFTPHLRLASKKKRELSEKVLSDFIKFLWSETAF
jgi:hypothetical protein